MANRTTPNPESRILKQAIIAGVGVEMPGGLGRPPEGSACVLLYVPNRFIVNQTALDIQEDIGLPWACEGEPGGVYLSDLLAAEGNNARANK